PNNLVARLPRFGRPLLLLCGLALRPAGEVVLAQGADRLAKRNIEGEDERAQEDRTEDQDAARRAGKACERITLRPADRAAAVSEGDIEEAERTEQEERDPQTTAPGHRLDPGHEQLAGGNQCRQDDEDHAPAKQANQSAPEQ